MTNLVADIKDALINATKAAEKEDKDYSVVYLPERGTAIHMATDSDPEAYGWEIITTVQIRK
jgi:hypothetical protein